MAEDHQLVELSPLQMRALTQEMQRMIREQNDALHERLDGLENRLPQDDVGGGGGRGGGVAAPRPNRMEGIKITIPPFHGKNDPDAYLEWELKIEHIFACNEYSDEQKVKMAAMEFTHYALLWWSRFQKERQREGLPVVNTWAEMKRIMRRRYVPGSYERDLKLKLQMLTQGSKGVEEYFKEMEMLIARANVVEEEEVTMVRFVGGLNGDIRDVVELHEYVEMSDLVHKATQVEQQLKRKSTTRRHSSNFVQASWRDQHGPKRDMATSSRSSRSPPKRNNPSKDEGLPKQRARDVKCFKCQGLGHYAHACPTKRTIVLKESGEYTSQSEASEGEHEESEEEVAATEGDLLMMRRLLGNQMRVFDDSQRENIFHTRCSINGKVCTLIIDGGSCTNVASTRLVSKLNLDTKPHPKPYKLQWLSEDGDLCVSQQVEVSLTIGKYEDKVLCDVVPMEACHILLGRPWQYDTKAIHDCFNNKFSFMHHDKKIVLKPLSLREVREDQIKMRKKIAQERNVSQQESVLSKKGEVCEKKKSEESKSETLEGKKSCLAKVSEVKRVLCVRQPLYLLYGKEQILNANKLDDLNLSSSVSSILQEFEALDWRTNPFQEGGNDENTTHDKDFEALGGHGVPKARTRTRTKKAREKHWGTKLEEEPKVEDIEPKWVNWVMIQEDPWEGPKRQRMMEAKEGPNCA